MHRVHLLCDVCRLLSPLLEELLFHNFRSQHSVYHLLGSSEINDFR